MTSLTPPEGWEERTDDWALRCDDGSIAPIGRAGMLGRLKAGMREGLMTRRVWTEPWREAELATLSAEDRDALLRVRWAAMDVLTLTDLHLEECGKLSPALAWGRELVLRCAVDALRKAIAAAEHIQDEA